MFAKHGIGLRQWNLRDAAIGGRAVTGFQVPLLHRRVRSDDHEIVALAEVFVRNSGRQDLDIPGVPSREI